MIAWWWLIVEAVAFVLLFGWTRGATRAVAICDALEDPDKARAELARRWKVKPESLLYRYRARLP